MPILDTVTPTQSSDYPQTALQTKLRSAKDLPIRIVEGDIDRSGNLEYSTYDQ